MTSAKRSMAFVGECLSQRGSLPRDLLSLCEPNDNRRRSRPRLYREVGAVAALTGKMLFLTGQERRLTERV